MKATFGLVFFLVCSVLVLHAAAVWAYSELREPGRPAARSGDRHPNVLLQYMW